MKDRTRPDTFGLNRHDHGLHSTNKSTYFTLTYPVYVSLKITMLWLYLIEPRSNSHQAISYTDLSQFLEQRAAATFRRL